MKLCMFHPVHQPLECRWVGRVDGDRVLHLAAQTLQSLFLGGGQAREHAEYPLDGVRLLPPVQTRRPSGCSRATDRSRSRTPRRSLAPTLKIRSPAFPETLGVSAAVIRAEGGIGGYTLLLDIRAPSLPPPRIATSRSRSARSS